jgi:hypothetical protein
MILFRKLASRTSYRLYLGSGTPLSTVHTLNHIPALVSRRGGHGRTCFTSADLQVAHTINLTEAQRLRIELNILNVFNQKTALHALTANRGEGVPVDSAINLAFVDLRKG